VTDGETESSSPSGGRSKQPYSRCSGTPDVPHEEPQPVPPQVRHIIAEGIVPLDPSAPFPRERAATGH